MEIKCEQIKRLVPFGAQKEATTGEIGYLKNIPLTNQCPECIDIWYEATLGQEDSSLCK